MNSPKLMTEEDFLLSEGEACPKCKEGDVDYTTNRFSASFGVATQGMRCMACNFRWKNVYTLSSYEVSDELV